MAVELTKEERASPLYKYYEMDIARPDPAMIAKVMAGPVDAQDALPVTEMNKLFDTGYLPCETGFALFPDGSAVSADLIDMPGVTAEMFDWWFAWHGLEAMRYKIWDKDDHWYALSRNPEKMRDTTIPLRERVWDTTHDVKECINPAMGPMVIEISFVKPEEIGFDADKYAAHIASGGTIICTGGPNAPSVMAHFVRKTEKGVELRTRNWFGWCLKNGKVERSSMPGMPPGAPIPPPMVQGMLLHNIKEFTNLASILPKVYAEFGGEV